VSLTSTTTIFTANGLKITPVGTATGATGTFDGLAHAGSGTCDNNLTPALSYSATDGNAPVNAGTYTLTVTCGANSNTYNTVVATAAITISPVAPTVAVTCPVSVVFNASAQTPCTAAVTAISGLNLKVDPTYSANTNAGTATASYSYAGGGNYLAGSASKTFAITAAASVGSVSCPASVLYTGLPQTPCTGAVSGPSLSIAWTPTYASNIVGLATAAVNYPGGGNYLSSSASTTFAILYVQSGCFASPVYSVQPPTKSYQKAGSNLPVKCSLLSSTGTAVTNATGSLLVQDRGLLGTDPPVTVFNQANVFKVDQNRNYNYGLDTGLPGFVSWHYYFVIASWNDGSTTTGSTGGASRSGGAS
jgi:hypothetical protein